jgi:flagellar hook-associated protein 1 FlgK
MSLFGSIRIGANSLRANDIALQVVGQNIANANTPSYIREDVILNPAPTQRVGGLLLGLGVQVDAVIQKIDSFLEERLRGAVSEQGEAETVEQVYAQLEGLINALADVNVGSLMTGFFNSISEILNQPGDRSIRNLVVLQGQRLAQDIQRLADRAQRLRNELNDRVKNMADDINRLLEEIRVLNVRISNTEGGQVSKSDAVGLRDQRLAALEKLARLIDIRVIEQPSSGVVVYRGGDYLVYEGTARQVQVALQYEGGYAKADIHLSDTDAPLSPNSGQLRGLLDARDQVLGRFVDQLDQFAKTLIFEFNKVHSSGQGLNGYTRLTSQYQVDDLAAPLDDAGLPFAPVNGSFQLLVYNRRTGLTKSTEIKVNLGGLGRPTTLTSLVDAINSQVEGVRAEINYDKRVTLRTLSAEDELAFANDTSGVLAALGLNVFFTGTGARDIAVSSEVTRDPAKFAASRSGVGADTSNAVEMSQLIDKPLASRDGASLAVLYNWLVSEATQGSAIAKSVADGARVFEISLRGQKLSTSGVNLDEEAVRMIAHQRAYQAAAKYIAALSELFELLVSL